MLATTQLVARPRHALSPFVSGRAILESEANSALEEAWAYLVLKEKLEETFSKANLVTSASVQGSAVESTAFSDAD